MKPIEQQQRRFKKLQRQIQRPPRKPKDEDVIDSFTGKPSSVKGLVPAEAVNLPEKNWPTMWVGPDKVEMKKTTSELLGRALNNSVQH